ncbi:hypothetical protein, partial [Bradyrhizobium sp. HKCCYLRH3061]|uniref:hypothetical protein n=1 Tax=Bradyrhizobium sp. HKCCYLRH3061 TaxID=3420734 RepID=UPI003EB6CDE9
MSAKARRATAEAIQGRARDSGLLRRFAPRNDDANNEAARRHFNRLLVMPGLDPRLSGSDRLDMVHGVDSSAVLS